MLPAGVKSVPPDGTAERPLGPLLPTSNDMAEAAMQPVVQDGHIAHWPGFEALLHYALYQQVSKMFLMHLVHLTLPVNEQYVCS